MSAVASADSTSGVGIFSRMLLESGPMTPEAARYFLSLGLSPSDKSRMSELAKRNQRGELSPSEIEELHAYARAGSVLSTFHLVARKALNQLPKPKRSRSKKHE